MRLENVLFEKRQGIVAYALCFRSTRYDDDDMDYQLAYGWANHSSYAYSHTVGGEYLNIITKDPRPTLSDEDSEVSYLVFNKVAPLDNLLKDTPVELDISTDDAYIFFLDKDDNVVKIVPFHMDNFEDTLKKYL